MMIAQDAAHGLKANLGNELALDGYVQQLLKRPMRERQTGQIRRRERQFDQIALVLGLKLLRRAAVFIMGFERGNSLLIETVDDLAHVIGREVERGGDLIGRFALRGTENNFGAANGDGVPASAQKSDKFLALMGLQTADTNKTHAAASCRNLAAVLLTQVKSTYYYFFGNGTSISDGHSEHEIEWQV